MPKRREREAKLNETDDDSSDGSGELCKVRKEEQRSAANRRERTRMRVLSKAFGKLKMTLPWVPLDTKLSKLDTLRLASSYIGHLNRMLISGEDTISSVNFCPENLVSFFNTLPAETFSVFELLEAFLRGRFSLV